MEDKNRIRIFDIAKGISIILMTISRYSFTEIYAVPIFQTEISTI